MDYTPKLAELAYKHLADGFSKEATAGRLGVSKQTLYNWIEKYPEFAEAVANGDAASQRWWEDRGREACSNGEFNGTVWSMNMKNRFGWRDKQEISGEDGGALVVKVVKHTDE